MVQNQFLVFVVGGPWFTPFSLSGDPSVQEGSVFLGTALVYPVENAMLNDSLTTEMLLEEYTN